jgi:hypothetical protein
LPTSSLQPASPDIDWSYVKELPLDPKWLAKVAEGPETPGSCVPFPKGVRYRRAAQAGRQAVSEVRELRGQASAGHRTEMGCSPGGVEPLPPPARVVEVRELP